jgi:hypothetical protein
VKIQNGIDLGRFCIGEEEEQRRRLAARQAGAPASKIC